MAVYDPSTGIWQIRQSKDGLISLQFGTEEDKLVVADYDGDERADIAVYRPSNGSGICNNRKPVLLLYSSENQRICWLQPTMMETDEQILRFIEAAPGLFSKAQPDSKQCDTAQVTTDRFRMLLFVK